MNENLTFTDLMRKYTRTATTFSEKLINAKFAMTIGTDDVYAEGVLAFFEIFRYLEHVMKAQEGRNLGRLLINGLERSSACIQDLNSYMGSNWVVPYNVRDSALKFINHMHSLYTTDPDLLIPYVYHLYMELLTGGQLIKTRKELDNVFDRHDGQLLGTALVDFGDQNPVELREALSREVNAIAETLNQEKKIQLIREGDVVFKHVNQVLSSIESVDRILTQRFIFLGLCILGLVIVLFLVSW